MKSTGGGFPLGEMAKRGWIKKRDNLRDHAEELVAELMNQAGCTRANCRTVPEDRPESRQRERLTHMPSTPGAGKSWPGPTRGTCSPTTVKTATTPS